MNVVERRTCVTEMPICDTCPIMSYSTSSELEAALGTAREQEVDLEARQLVL